MCGGGECAVSQSGSEIAAVDKVEGVAKGACSGGGAEEMRCS